ncbi:MAG: hypothetical protein ACOVQA_00070 [Thermoflexibacteraceae bacterium]
MNKETVIAEIKQKTGVDFSQYQTRELVEKIEAAFTSIPKAQMTILLPIIVIAAIDILWLLLRSNQSALAIVLFIFWLLGAVFVGGSWGLYKATQNILEDMQTAISITIDTTVLIYKDLHQTSQKVVEKDLQIPTTSDLLRGVALGIVFPALSNFAIQKAGVLAKMIVWVVEKTFLQIIIRLVQFVESTVTKGIDKLSVQPIDSKIENLNAALDQKAQLLQNKLKKIEQFMNILITAKGHINGFINSTKKVVGTPILTTSIILAIGSLLFTGILAIFM